MSDFTTVWIDSDGVAVNDEDDMLVNYRDTLDDIYGTVNVAGFVYDTARILEHIDPIAFRQGFLDYCDNGWTEWDIPTELFLNSDPEQILEYLGL